MMDSRDGLAALAPVANGPDSTLLNATYLPPLDSFQNLARLAERDRLNVQYAKEELNEGDTLVFVQHPNGRRIQDQNGFELRGRYIVHAENLKATGSEYFTSRLESREHQLKLQRRFGLVGRLPDGIQYLLDLKPPEEGEDALVLLALLCCPTGVRKWHTAEKRCGVPNKLVGGESEISLKYLQHLTDGESSILPTSEDALEYCPIRHRIGIEKILQIIEGNQPQLDSAPKVWTLVILANQFECVKMVEDYVLAWLLVEPNNRFIEILPEATLRIGIMLQNEYLTRAAFAILVSEESLRLGSGNFYREYKSSELDVVIPISKKFTRLGRPIEDIIDEDWINIIQYAARALSSRINQQVMELLEPEISWVEKLPEYQKITNFKQFINEAVEFGNQTALAKFAQQAEFAHEGIRDLVRGRLFNCVLAHLDTQRGYRLHANRVCENYLSQPHQHCSEIYSSLNDQERVMTRPFWELVEQLGWYWSFKTNEIFEKCPTDSMQHDLNMCLGESYRVRYVDTHMIHRVAKNLNLAIFTTARQMGYNGGILPPETYGSFLDSMADMPDNELDFSSLSLNLESLDIHNSGTRQLSVQATRNYAESDFTSFDEDSNINTSFVVNGEDNSPELAPYCSYSMFPVDEDIDPQSIYFNLSRLLVQIGDHLQSIASANLSKSNFDATCLCDSLISLSDKEYAFLPLWAGGMDDGSGGVFAGTVPPAERGGPSGPGPAYNTGSTINSAASSELNFETESYSALYSINDSFDTSMGVENGESDHLHRHEIISEEDFPLTDTQSMDDGQSIDTLGHTGPVAMTSGIISSYIEDENFFNVPEDDDDIVGNDEDWDVLDEEDDGNDTETEN